MDEAPAVTPSEIAVMMNSLRWSKTTPEERLAVAMKLVAARRRLRRERQRAATARTRTANGRSRKGKKAKS